MALAVQVQKGGMGLKQKNYTIYLFIIRDSFRLFCVSCRSSTMQEFNHPSWYIKCEQWTWDNYEFLRHSPLNPQQCPPKEKKCASSRKWVTWESTRESLVNRIHLLDSAIYFLAAFCQHPTYWDVYFWERRFLGSLRQTSLSRNHLT